MSAPVPKPEEDYITIVDLWRLCVANYWWFIITVFITIAAAIYYLVITPNQYTREAAILVNQEAPGKNTASIDGNNFSTIGLVQQPTNLSNVQRHIASLDILMAVADRLHLASPDSILRKAQGMQKRLKVELEDEKSTIINLKYQGSSTDEADRILYTLVEVYNEKTDQKKHLVNQHTSAFIDQRLHLLQSELDNIDDSISSFKSHNLITNLDQVSDIALKHQDQAEAQVFKLSNQKAVSQYIDDLLSESTKTHKFLPANSGTGSSVIETQIAQYNALLMQYNSHRSYTTTQNPVIAEYSAQLNDMRGNIKRSVEGHINSLDAQLQKLLSYGGEAESRIASNPEQAKRIAAVERQQKVKESIFLYLLQKKEENEMNMTYTSQATELIDVPHGSDSPTSPNKRNVILSAIVLGLVVPVITLFIRESILPAERRLSTRRKKKKHPIDQKISATI